MSSIQEFVNVFFNSLFGSKSKLDTLKKEVVSLKSELIKKTKEENNSKNEFIAIQESLHNFENEDYLALASENFAKSEYLEIMNKKMPEEMTKMVPDEGPNHLIIEKKEGLEEKKENPSNELKRKSFVFEEKHSILKGEQHIENYIDDDQQFLIEGTKNIWKWLRIDEEMDKQNKESCFFNFQKDLEDLQKLDLDLLQFFSPYLNEINDKSYKELIQIIYENYTENAYEMINKITSAKDPVVLLKIKYLIQFFLYNHRDPIYGEKIDPKKPLYRMITIKKELNVLYKKNSTIFFTSPTIVSNSEPKPKISSSLDTISIKFRFKILPLSKQTALNFFSGVSLKNNDIVIMPYQLFLIENVERKSDKTTKITFYEVSLKEIQNKLLIKKLEKKIGRKIIKDEEREKFEKSDIIKELQLISIEKEKEIQKIGGEKEHLVEEVKGKINEIFMDKMEEHKEEELDKEKEKMFDLIINADEKILVENLFEPNLEEIKEKVFPEPEEEKNEPNEIIENQNKASLYEQYVATFEEKVVADPSNIFRRITIEKNKYFVDFDFLSLILGKVYQDFAEIPIFFMNYLLKTKIKENEDSNFVFEDHHLSKEGNYNYTYANFFEEVRGGLVYNFPNGWKRIGLNVNTFNIPSKDWIGMINNKGEYANLFCLVKNRVIDDSVFESENNNKFSKDKKKIERNGVQACSNINFLQKYIEKVEIAGQRFLIALQCRAPNFDIQFTNAKKEVYVVGREEVIRPYGILIKKVE